jgi:ATP-binding cassette subfamily F protein 3
VGLQEQRLYLLVSYLSPLSEPASAVELLPGLGFSEEDQGRPTRSFSGGWRYAKLS